MILMPSNNVGPIVRKLFREFPENIAQLMSPDGWRPPKHQYALDNGAFRTFNENLYFKMLDKSKKYEKPLFVVCPDVVGCHDRTIALWNYYYPLLCRYGYPIAFVAQDGCEPNTVPKNADWIFIGGAPQTSWKFDNAYKFIGDRPVHVGRVNSIGAVKYLESIGVTSIDGTGWMRARDKKYYDFIEYFEGEKQCSLF